MPDSLSVFHKILSDKNPIAIFDLDSTLFNVSFRTQKIIEDFSQLLLNSSEHVQLAQELKQVKVEHTDWGLKEPLSRANIQAPQQVFQSLKNFWQTHFFSSHYLHFDQPYQGASEYVTALKNSGVQIHYLTGRDHKNMYQGTIETLLKHNFPLQDPDKQLSMKPIKGSAEDEDFKADRISLIGERSQNLWFFENEPVIINKIRNQHTHVKLIWVDTTHSRREKPPADIFRIEDKWVY